MYRVVAGSQPAGGLRARHHTADHIVRMRIADLDASERGKLAWQKIDAVIDQQPAVDFRCLSDETSFEQMLGLFACAGDDRVEWLTELRLVARTRDLLLQCHQFRASPFGCLACWRVLHLRGRCELLR